MGILAYVPREPLDIVHAFLLIVKPGNSIEYFPFFFLTLKICRVVMVYGSALTVLCTLQGDI